MKSPTSRHRCLILGGVKSGKSRHAEWLAEAYSQTHNASVTLIATATADDAEMRKRIARHKADRNPSWRVVEEPVSLGKALRKLDTDSAAAGGTACIVIDCLTLWLTNLLMISDEKMLRQEIADFHEATRQCQSALFVVSNETNLGITPIGELSRQFCDEAGLLHQELGQVFERVTLIVAGIPLSIKGQ